MTRSKVYTPLILNTVLSPEWSSAVFVCLVIVVRESLVCPEQLNCLLFFRKILQLTQILCLFSIFVYLNSFQQWDQYFHTEDNWGTHMKLLKKIQKLQKDKPCIKAGGWKLLNIFFLIILPKYHILFSTALQKLQNILTCFPEDKIS